MTWYFLEANDVLMFRDGRPFSAGEMHLIESLFPPSALSMQGALRALVLANAGMLAQGRQTARHPHVGIGDDLGVFAMHGPYIAFAERPQGLSTIRHIVPYLPLPADVVYTKNKQFTRLRPAEMQDSEQLNLPHVTRWRLSSDGATVDDSPDEPLIPIPVLNDYLGGQVPQYDDDLTYHNRGLKYAHDLICDEPRFGIGLNADTRTAEESMLYRAAFKRPKQNIGLLVYVDDAVPPLQTGTVFPLGGEAHTVTIHAVDKALIDPIPISRAAFAPHARGIKLILTTPAWFMGNMWRPEDWIRFFPSGKTPEFITAGLPRYQSIGGWSMAKNQARHMLRLIPAGSVYYFEGVETPLDIPLTDSPDGYPDFTKLGYGRFIVTTWEA